MKKLINSFIVAASLAFTSITQAALITDIDSTDFFSRVTGGTTVTQYIDATNYIDYQYKDNYVLLDFNVTNFNYVFYDFTINVFNTINASPLKNAYITSGFDYYDFDSINEYINVSYPVNQLNGTKIGLEIDSSLEFFNVDLINQQFGDYAYLYTENFTIEHLTTLANFDVRLAGSGSAVAAVPEPSTLAIFALALFGLASRKFNKKN